MMTCQKPSRGNTRGPAVAVAAVVAVVLAGCAPELTGADHSVYPRFSLVGDLPERVTEFELTIDAADMTAVSETISAGDGPHTVAVPRGENRLIELLAVDDVYSGRVTVSRLD